MENSGTLISLWFIKHLGCKLGDRELSDMSVLAAGEFEEMSGGCEAI